MSLLLALTILLGLAPALPVQEKESATEPPFSWTASWWSGALSAPIRRTPPIRS